MRVGTPERRAAQSPPATPDIAAPPWLIGGYYLLLGVIVLYPILCVRTTIPGDLANHLARMHIVASIDGSPELQRFYQVVWAPIPYLAMDVIVPALARVMTIYDAGRVFFALCVLLPPLSAAVLHYAVHGRIGMTPALAFLFSYNYLLSWGFANYVFAAPLAVMLFAGWVATEGWRRRNRLPLFAVAATVLFLAHAFAFLAYGIAVAGYELGRAWRLRPGRGVLVADWLSAAAQALPAVVITLAVKTAGQGLVSSETVFGFANKLQALLAPVQFSEDRTELPILILLGAGGLALLPRVRLAPGLAPALLAVALVAALIPQETFGVVATDLRLPLVLALLGAGSLRLDFGPRGWSLLLVFLLAATGLKAWQASRILRQLDSEVSEARDVLAHLPKGETVLPVLGDHPRMERRLTWHIGTIAVIERDAFVPLLFTGTTIVVARPAYADRIAKVGADFATRRDLLLQPSLAPAYLKDWPEHYDYVLLREHGTGYVVPDFLARVAAAPSVDLLRIEKRR